MAEEHVLGLRQPISVEPHAKLDVLSAGAICDSHLFVMDPTCFNPPVRACSRFCCPIIANKRPSLCANGGAIRPTGENSPTDFLGIHAPTRRCASLRGYTERRHTTCATQQSLKAKEKRAQ